MVAGDAGGVGDAGDVAGAAGGERGRSFSPESWRLNERPPMVAGDAGALLGVPTAALLCEVIVEKVCVIVLVVLMFPPPPSERDRRTRV